MEPLMMAAVKKTRKTMRSVMLKNPAWTTPDIQEI
jgi:hypothetical protein